MTVLDVYVTTGCANCDYARGVASRAAEAFPALSVRVLELGAIPNPPEAVFATPTYVLDDKVISLGNPDEQELNAALSNALSGR